MEKNEDGPKCSLLMDGSEALEQADEPSRRLEKGAKAEHPLGGGALWLPEVGGTRMAEEESALLKKQDEEEYRRLSGRDGLEDGQYPDEEEDLSRGGVELEHEYEDEEDTPPGSREDKLGGHRIEEEESTRFRDGDDE